MAGDNRTLTYTIKAVTDISDVQKNVNSLKDVLKQIKLPDNLAQGFEKSFGSIEKEIEKAQVQMNKGFKTKGDVSNFEKAMASIVTQIENVGTKIKGIDLKKLMGNTNFNFSGFEKINKEISDLQAKIAEIKSKPLTIKTDVGKSFGELNQIMGRTSQSAQNLQTILNKKTHSEEDYKNITKALNGIKTGYRQVINEYEKAGGDALAPDDKIRVKFEAYSRAVKSAELAVADFKNKGAGLQNLEGQLDEKTTQRFEWLQQMIQSGLIPGIQQLTISTKEYIGQTKMATDQSMQLSTSLDQFKSRITYFFGLTNGVQLLRRAFRETYQAVKELDDQMTEMAVVTDLGIGGYWDQMPEYTKRANELGISIKGVYEADTLFYQQGLKTNEVVALSTETLKMARIAGLESEEATNRMTAALRGFNMELTEASAQNVNDVYSKLAAITASDVDEISTAMGKTASIASNAKMTFENTTAFLAQIIETTREAPETAGTALKTIIARFSEVKTLYDQGVFSGKDEEGEAIEVNKIATALKTAGINMNAFFAGTEGLDSIFMKLAQKWDTLSTVQQRYIATQAAGSRQQSRFIALMSNYERTLELTEAAQNATGASDEQFGKTLDSVETAVTRLKNAWTTFITSLGNNEIIIAVVNALTGLLNGVNNFFNLFKQGTVRAIVQLGALTGGFFVLKKIANSVTISIVSGFKKTTAEAMKSSAATTAATTAESVSIKALGAQYKQGLMSKKAYVAASREAIRSHQGLASAIFAQAGATSGLNTSERAKIVTSLAENKITEEQIALLSKEEIARYLAIAAEDEEVGAKALSIMLTKAQIKQSIKATLTRLNNVAVMILETGKQIVQNAVLAIAAVRQMIATKEKKKGIIVRIKNTIATWAEVVAQYAELAVVLLLIAAVALLAVGIVLLWKAHMTLDEKIEASDKHLQDLQKSATDAASKFSELKDTMETLSDQQKNIETLTEGTEEWTKATEELNNQVLELLQTYPELAAAIDTSNGYMQIDQNSEAYKQFMQNQRKTVQDKQALVVGEQVYNAKLKQEKLDKNKNKEAYEDFTNGTMAEKAKDKGMNLEEYWKKELKGVDDSFDDFCDNAKDYANQVKQLSDTTKLANQQLINSMVNGSGLTGKAKDRASEMLKGDNGSGDIVSGVVDNFKAGIEEEVDNQTGDKVDSAFFNEGMGIGAAIGAGIGILVAGIAIAATGGAALPVIVGAMLAGGAGVGTVGSLVGTATQNIIDETSGITSDNMEKYGKAKYGSKYKKTKGKYIYYEDDEGKEQKEKLTAEELNTGLAALKLQEEGMEDLKSLNWSLNIDVDNIEISDDNLWKDDYINQIKEKQEEIDSSLGEIGLSVEATFDGDYEKAEGLATSFDSIKENLTSLGATNEEVTQIFDGVTAENAEEFAEFYGNVNWNSAIEGAAALKKGMEEQSDAVKESIEDYASLEETQTKYNSTAQASEVYLSLTTEELSSLSEEGEITAEKIKELSKSNASLATMLDNTGASTNSVATYFQALNDGILSTLDTSEDFLKVLNKLQAAENAISDTFELIDNLEISRSTAEIGSSFKDYYDKFKELSELGLYSSDAIIDYEKMWLGEEGYDKVIEKFGGDMEQVANYVSETMSKLKNGTFYELWSSGADQSGGMWTVDTSGNIQFAMDQIDSVESLYAKVMDVYGVSEEVAKAMVAEAEDTSASFKQSLKRLQLGESVNEWISSSAKTLVDGTTILSKSQLELIAKEAGVEYETLAKMIEDQIEDVKIVDYITDGVLNDEGEKELTRQIQNQIKSGVNVTVEDIVKYAKQMGVNDEELQTYVAGFIDKNNGTTFNITVSGDEGSSLDVTNAIEKMQNEELAQMDEDAKNQARNVATGVGAALTTVLPGILNAYIKEVKDDKLPDFSTLYDKTVAAVGSATSAASKNESDSTTTNGSTKTVDLSSLNTGAASNNEQDTYTTDGSKNVNLVGKDDSIWQNPYDEYINLLEEITETERQRNKLEREYNRLLRDSNSSIKDINKNYMAQLSSIENERNKKLAYAEGKKSQINNLAKSNGYYNEDTKEYESYSDVKKYASYDFEKGTIVYDWKAINSVTDEKTGKKIESYLSKLEEYAGDYEEYMDDADEKLDEYYEKQQEAIENWLDIENDVLEALKNVYQGVIDTQQAMFDALSESENKVLENLQEQVDLERQIRDNTEKENDISEKEAQLAYLSRDTTGASDLEILNLQKDLDDARQDYTDSLIDQALSQMQTDNEKAQEQRSQMIDRMNWQLQWMTDNGVLWDQVHDILDKGFDSNGNLVNNSALVELMTSENGVASMSDDGKGKWANNLAETFANGLQGEAAAKITKAENEGSITIGKQSYTLKDDGKGGKQWVNNATGEKYAQSALSYDVTSEKYTMDTTNGKISDDNGKANGGGSVSSATATTDDDGDNYGNNTYQGIYDKTKVAKAIDKVDTTKQDEMYDASTRTSTSIKDRHYVKYIGTYNGKKYYQDQGNTKNIIDESKVSTDEKGYNYVSKDTKLTDGWIVPIANGPNGLPGENTRLVVDDKIYKPSVKRAKKENGQWMELYWFVNAVKSTGGATIYANALSDNSGLRGNYHFYKIGNDNVAFKLSGKRYATGGLADYTGPAWLDGTKSRPELVLNQTDTQNFIQLRDILRGMESPSQTSVGGVTASVQINVEQLSDDYDVDRLASRVQQKIYEAGSYRNNNIISGLR